MKYLMVLLLILGSVNPMILAEDVGLDLAKKVAQPEHQDKVHILYFSASYCSFCADLEENVLHAVRVNKDYQKQVFISEISLDESTVITDFKGNTIDADEFIDRYDVSFTPTLIFVDNQGNEIAKRRKGYQNVEFYWYYLDISIANGLKAIQSQ